MAIISTPLDVSVIYSSELVAAEIRDRRSQTLALFSPLDENQRAALAHDAWMIGLRALANAHLEAQESRLQDVGSELIADIDRQLRGHIEVQQQTIMSVLKKFFDPTDGQISQRLAAFVGDQGVLAHILERYLSPQNSVLAQTLARQVGDSSPLFKKLSATESDGVIQLLEAQLRAVLNDEHAELVRALDPLEPDGAIARFLRSLRDELKGADEDRAKQLASALAALNANDDNSLINRLVRETSRARQEVLTAVNPDAPGSPMGIMKGSLTKYPPLRFWHADSAHWLQPFFLPRCATGHAAGTVYNCYFECPGSSLCMAATIPILYIFHGTGMQCIHVLTGVYHVRFDWDYWYHAEFGEVQALLMLCIVSSAHFHESLQHRGRSPIRLRIARQSGCRSLAHRIPAYRLNPGMLRGRLTNRHTVLAATRGNR